MLFKADFQSNALGYGAVRSSLRKQTGRRQAAEQPTATCGGNAQFFINNTSRKSAYFSRTISSPISKIRRLGALKASARFLSKGFPLVLAVLW